MSWLFKPRTSGAIILLYHRVADVKDDPLLLSVSPENFRAQLKAIKKILPAISLQQIAADIAQGKNPRGFAVTFDDGYVDNLLSATPVLEDLKIPASIYVVAGKVNQQTPFDWDKKTAASDQGRAMNEAELKKLATSKVIEVGAHTVSHPHLGLLKATDQQQEITQSKKILEDYLGQPVTGFAYPFGAYEGDFNEVTKKACQDAGFNYACANIPGTVTKDSGLYALPRVLVRDWSPQEMLDNLKQYMPHEHPAN